jgi:peptide deformylase
MKLEIVQAGDPVLRRPAAPVPAEAIRSPYIQELICAMRHTLHGVGVGLAAPQVGISLQLAVLEDRPENLEWMSEARQRELERVPLPFRVLINPTFEPAGEQQVEAFEGCLSVEGWQAAVPRWQAVRVRGLDQNAEPVDEVLEGWPARIVQHELDHLAGVLYLDRMLTRTFTTPANLGRYWHGRPIDEVKRECGTDGE